jgi:hypothetical protein
MFTFGQVKVCLLGEGASDGFVTDESPSEAAELSCCEVMTNQQLLSSLGLATQSRNPYVDLFMVVQLTLHITIFTSRARDAKYLWMWLLCILDSYYYFLNRAT